jgi:hypothetical protein
LQFWKNSGLYLQKRVANIKGMDLIHRIKIRRPGFNAGEGVRVDRYASLTGWLDLIQAVGWGTGGPDIAQAAAAEQGRRRRRDAAVLGGGSPAHSGTGAGVHQKRRGRHQDG